MAKFLSSNKVKVFPTAFRGKDSNGKVIDPNAFLTTEENIVNIANKVTYRGKNYFWNDGGTIHLILGGYYFVFSKDDVTSQFTNPSNDDEIYAGINIDNLTTSYESYQAKTLTPNGGSAGDILDTAAGVVQEFKGLSFVLGNDQSLSGFTYSLPLFGYKGAWKDNVLSVLNISTHQIKDGDGEDFGTGKPITSEFTTGSVNANRLNLKGNIIPVVSNNAYKIGSVSAPFKSIYVNDIYATNITGLGGASITVSTPGYSLVTTNAIDITTGAYTLQASQSLNLSAASNITLRANGTLSLSVANTHANIYSSGINLSTNGDISLNADVISINNDDYARMYSPSMFELSTSTYALRLQDRRVFLGYGSQSCMFETSTNHITNFAAVYTSASLCIKDFKSISIDDYKLRPFEHRMMITLSNSASNKATIIANPKLFTSQPISTKSELLTALNSASYFIQMSTASGNVYSPLVATGKFYRSGLDTIYDVMGIGVGTYGGNSVLYLMCWEDSDNSKSLTYDIVDIDSYTYEIKDLV